MAAKYLLHARNYLGYHEENDNKALKKLFSKNMIPIDPAKTAWCASFVEAILRLAGSRGTGKLTARSYLKWGKAVDFLGLQVGDIIVLKRGLPWQGHVGLYTGNKSSRTIELIGGNQDNSVSVKYYPINKIIGIRR